MKKLLIPLILLVVVAGVYFVLSKGNFKNLYFSNSKTFTHSSEAYSFKYPSNLFVKEASEGSVLISDEEKVEKPFASVASIYWPNYISNLLKGREGVNIKNGIQDGLKMYIISYDKYPQYIYQYVVSLEDSDNPSYFLLVTITPNTRGFTQEKFDGIFKSLKIDLEKTKLLANKAREIVQQKAIDAKLKANLSSLRPVAEMLFDADQSYTSLCSPKGNTKTEKQINELFSIITKDIGQSNLYCKANKSNYSISIKLTSNSFWCVDSSGISSEIKALNFGYSCK